MSDTLTRLNRAIEDASPAMAAALSPLGRRIFFPPDIPYQAAQARHKELNGTIGQITDGNGGALAPPALAGAIAGLEPALANRAILYSPVEGIGELREAWRGWQRRGPGGADAPASSLPIVTVGLTHGLSLVADLFGGEGRTVAVPAPFWGNYRQTFVTRTGARMVSAPVYRDGRYNPRAIPEALADLTPGEPAVAILNLPSNPGGYSLNEEERRQVRAALVEEAERRPLVVVLDDAYAGLVYEPAIPRRSMFWELAGAHPDLVPVKVDGATKEISFFGGRVGFLTFACEPKSALAEALESKVKCLTRATVGSPVAASQAIALQALSNPALAEQLEAIRLRLERRYRVLHQALEAVDRRLLDPLPFNSGCFALVGLPEGIDPDATRRHLLDAYDTGLIAINPRYLRIAFCSVEADKLPEVVRRLERAVAELVAARG